MNTAFASRLLGHTDHAPPGTSALVGVVTGLVVSAAVILNGSSLAIAVLAISTLALGAALAFTGRPVSVLTVEQDHPALIRDTRCRVLPPGAFYLGNPPGRGYPAEQPARHIQIGAFQCMIVPVTRRLFEQVMGKDPGWPRRGSGRMPANNVSWLEAVEFCNELSELMGLTPCYEFKDGTLVVWHDTDGFRLPCEQEWEYACRGGSWGDYCFGNDVTSLEHYAWFEDNAARHPRIVARKRPNAWGLHDTHGNVWEWCWDEYASYDRPRRPHETRIARLDTGRRVVRGGAYFLPAGTLRSTVRRGEVPLDRDASIGFRCVRGRLSRI